MNISDLCDRINLLPEVKSKVLSFSNEFDFSLVNSQLNQFRHYEKMSQALSELQMLLGDDSDRIKILSCMLKASADIYEIYKAKGIEDDIYFATMKCYSRFISETNKITGKMFFDRYWWTARQAGFHLFRIGELEYEKRIVNGKTIVEIHIPSDAVFSPADVDRSLAQAKQFFETFFPESSIDEYCCHSWFLDLQIGKMLNEDANIRNFQRRFEILNEGESDIEFIEWLYNMRTSDYKTLPEKTSLQRKVKNHLLSGGVIRNSYGRLK